MIIFLINVILILLILFIIWWFWLYKPKAPKNIFSDHVKIIVENGTFTPDIIHAQYDSPITLEFVRKDKSHCADSIQIPAFNQHLDLPGKLTFTPDQTGNFDFECPMKMYRGTIIVEKADAVTGVTEIIVDGGVYIPSEIYAPKGVPITLRFIRKDKSHCAESVVFADFDISEDLPIDQPKEIIIEPKEPGTYKFACPMNMYVGKLIIE